MKQVLSSLARRITNLLARGAVTLANSAGKMQTLQVSLLADEGKQAMEHFEAYGLTSNPKAGAEVLAVFLDGDRSHGVVLCATDRRYRVKNLQSGEVAIYDDLGHVVKLARTGIVIDGATHNISIINCPNVTVTGGDVVADGISLKAHKHSGVQAGSTQTGTPV